MTSVARVVAVSAAAALVLSSCGGSGDEGQAAQTPAASPTPSPSSTVNVPGSVELTEVGADLSFGDSATVIYEPSQKRGSVLELTVEKARQGRTEDFAGFVLDDYTRNATPYYVDVSVENVGESNVGGAAVPLWGVDGTNTLLPPATFTTRFSTCPSEKLPKKFGPGESFSTCLVYFAPDKGLMESVSFRPNQEFDPIEWTGQILSPKPEKSAEKQQGNGKKKQGKRNGGS